METTSSLVACVGAGVSGIALGAQLKRWYNVTDVTFFDRHETSGGTWWINSYPGCACDVPVPLYSFSFDQSAEWSSLFPPAIEMKGYLDRVAKKYDLPSKMKFRREVESATWDSTIQSWVLIVRNLETEQVSRHVSKILFGCTGILVRPNELDIPGTEDFKGDIFHSALWNKDVDLAGKKVVLIGNGCTAAQIVPALMQREKAPAELTQIVRSKHWILEPTTVAYTPILRFILNYSPGAKSLLRFIVFCIAEASFPFFYNNPIAVWYRKWATARAQKYMRKKAPPHLHDALIPDFDLGCKRRIFDPGYLDILHDYRVHIEQRRATRVTPTGIQFADGAEVEADAIVMANGFKTNYFLDGLKVTGIGGKTLEKHWSEFEGPGAYNCSTLSGFPNFFMILGPNSGTGHTSAIMASENSINYALRVLRPVIENSAQTVDLKAEAERKYVYRMQGALKNRVWSTGCNSWYVQDNKWNSMAYPWSQLHYWFRSLFPTWADLEFKS